MTQDTIEREITINAPVERVWQVLTEAEHVGAWFGDAGAEVDLRPGGAMAFHWKQHGTALARIEQLDPPRFFSYRWAPFGERTGEEPRAGNSTLVEFTLEPDGDGTRLRVVERGFADLDGSDEQRAEALAGNTRGWRMELDELRAHAEGVAAR